MSAMGTGPEICLKSSKESAIFSGSPVIEDQGTSRQLLICIGQYLINLSAVVYVELERIPGEGFPGNREMAAAINFANGSNYGATLPLNRESTDLLLAALRKRGLLME